MSVRSAHWTVEFIVAEYLHGVRIDSFLARHLRNHSSWRIQRFVRAGQVTVDGALAEETTRVHAGEVVRANIIEPPDKLLKPEARELEILYEDPWLVVVNKPAGLIAHPTGEYQTGSLANVLQHHLDQQTPLKGLVRPGIVHRLDRQTSGLMVVAYDHFSHRQLSTAFENGRVSKQYLALVEGDVKQQTGVIDQAIGRAATGRHVLMSARADALDRKPAKTHYEVLQRFGTHTLLLAKPLTGRNHQIRVHFAHIGHPLVGDEFYEAHGSFKPFRPPRRNPSPSTTSSKVPSQARGIAHHPLDSKNAEIEGFSDIEEEFELSEIETGLPLKRHALHACHLAFGHPLTGTWLEFQAPPPDDFRDSVKQLEIDNHDV